ncbi:MAG: hypothetical protein DCF19_04695 [Pseudanabaena frigida]|uniref:Uncharacterized protein n=1 Tax=Pseudanabaena frigida TaxID=945775 RepID=A0A2W4Y8E6_9CYAN|nr:MAG: hypothetical protein DCF19_04695 [Pseudanabaena frigida]
MNVQYLKQLIEKTINQPWLPIEVNSIAQNLSIIINRPDDGVEVDYKSLMKQIIDVIVNKELDDILGIDVIKFYGRIQGQPKVEWGETYSLLQSKLLINSTQSQDTPSVKSQELLLEAVYQVPLSVWLTIFAESARHSLSLDDLNPDMTLGDRLERGLIELESVVEALEDGYDYSDETTISDSDYMDMIGIGDTNLGGWVPGDDDD